MVTYVDIRPESPLELNFQWDVVHKTTPHGMAEQPTAISTFAIDCTTPTVCGGVVGRTRATKIVKKKRIYILEGLSVTPCPIKHPLTSRIRQAEYDDIGKLICMRCPNGTQETRAPSNERKFFFIRLFLAVVVVRHNVPIEFSTVHSTFQCNMVFELMVLTVLYVQQLLLKT